MRETVAMLAMAMTVLAGCGGGSDETAGPSPAPSTSVPPPQHSAEEMADALPSVKDVPRATKRVPGCPTDDEACSEAEGVSVDRGVSFELKPLRDLTAAEQASDLPTISEFVQMSGKRFTTPPRAADVAAEVRTRNAEWAGSFATKAVRTDAKTYQPGLRGRGRTQDVTISGFTGTLAARRFQLINPEGREGPQLVDAYLSVSLGTTEVTASAVLRAEGRGPQEAVDLVKHQVADYIERLG